MTKDEKLGLWFGPGKAPKSQQTTNKDWSSDWLRMKEANLLEAGGKITSPYTQSAWVYRAIRVIAENAPTANYKIYNGEQVLPPTHPVVQLFLNPNPVMSRFDFWEAISSWLNLRGEAFIWVNQSLGGVLGRGTAPAQLWVLNPDYMKHALDKNGMIQGWTYANEVPFDPTEIMHLPLWNPKGLRGQSPITAAKAEMNADYSAAQWNKVFFDNNATPDGVVSVDKDVSIEIEDLRKIKKMWYEKHGGQGNSHKTAFLLGGMDYKNIGISQRDMEFIQGRQFSRDAIYAIFGVPPFVAGHYDSGTVTRATARESKRLFWTGTLIPQLTRIQEKLAVKFFPIYAPGLTGVFDYGQVEELQEDFNESVVAANSLFSLGYTRNEINERLRLGMPRDDTDGDERYLPINYVPVGVDETPPEKAVKVSETKEVKVSRTKNAFARRYARLQRQIENLLLSRIKKLLFNQRKSVLKIVNGKKATLQEMELLAEINAFFAEEQDKWATAIAPILTEAAEETIDMASNNIGLEARQFIVNQSIIDDRLNMVKGATNTIFRQIKDQINEGIKEGEAIASISDRIRSVYNISQNRAKVIARTESSSLMSAQTMDVYLKGGITRKSWVTAGDDKVRDTHIQNAEDGPIGIDKTFSGTGEEYPGQTEINCRCALVPEVVEET